MFTSSITHILLLSSHTWNSQRNVFTSSITHILLLSSHTWNSQREMRLHHLSPTFCCCHLSPEIVMCLHHLSPTFCCCVLAPETVREKCVYIIHHPHSAVVVSHLKQTAMCLHHSSSTFCCCCLTPEIESNMFTLSITHILLLSSHIWNREKLVRIIYHPHSGVVLLHLKQPESNAFQTDS